MSEHARLSPSAAYRWMACPASVGMIEGMEERTSEAAEQGTIAHGVLEAALENWIATGDQDVICDDEDMREAVQAAFDHIIEVYEATPGGSKRLLIESQVDLHYYTGRKDLWGTSDVIIETTKVLDITDYKHGSGVFVDAVDNPQLKIYALGAMAPRLKETKGDTPWEKIRCRIIQPRCPGKGGEIVREVTYTPDELLVWAESVLKPACEATDQPDIAPVAGDSQCRWCPAKAHCPAAGQKVKDLCQVFQPVPGAGPALPPTGSSPELLSVEELIEIHDNAPFIKGFLKSVDDRIRSLLQQRDPEMSQRLKLVRTRQINIWIDEEAMVNDVTKVGTENRVMKKLLLKEEVISAPQALKLKLKPGQKARLQKHIKKSEGSLAIVPLSDERENVYPALNFEPVETTDPYDFI